MTFETFFQIVSGKVVQPVPTRATHEPAHELSLSIRGQKKNIAVEHIAYFEGDGNYTNIVLGDGTKLLVARTLKEYEALLENRVFVRIHKSCIINLRFVRRVNMSHGRALELVNGQQVQMSRRRLQEFKEWVPEPA